MSQTATVTSNAAEFNRSLDAFVRVYTRKDGRSIKDALAAEGRKFSFELSSLLKQNAPNPGEIREERLAAFKHGEGLRIHNRKITQVGLDKPMTMQDVIKGRVWGPRTKLTRTTAKGKGGRVIKNRIGGKSVDQWQEEYTSRARKLFGEMKNRKSVSGAAKMAIQSMLADLEIKYREKARGYLAFAARFTTPISKESITYIAGQDRVGNAVKLAAANLHKSGDAWSLDMEWGSDIGKSSAGAASGLNKPQNARMIDQALGNRAKGMMKYVEDRMAKDWAKV